LPSRTPPPDGKDPRGEGAQDWTRALREAGPYLGLGTTLAVTVLAGLGGGYWLDGRLGTPPVFLLVGGTLGVGVALYSFDRATSDLTKRQGGRQR
jgi:F0F1-type ATP synthase assembly protein I